MKTIKDEKKLLEGLDFVWLELTNFCNLNCTHCYAESSPYSNHGTMKLTDWKKAIKEVKELGTERIQFIGGEPTLHPYFTELLTYAGESGLQIEVFTNCTYLTEEMIQLMERFHVQIATSFYSFEPEIHEIITTKKGSWEKTVANIKLIVNKKIPIRAGVITMNANRHQYEKTKEFLKTIGVQENMIAEDGIREIGRGQISSNKDNLFDSLCHQCWKGYLAIDSNGLVFPCVFSRSKIVGNLNQNSFEEIIKSNDLLSFRNQSKFYHDQKRSLIESDVTSCNPFPTPCNPNKCYPDMGGPCAPCLPSCSPNCNPNCGPSFGV